MKLLISILLCLSAALLSAQESYDIIHLKDGGIYQGRITEYVPANHAVIQLLDGRFVTVEADKIQTFTIGEKEIIKKNFDIKQKGYFNNTLLGPQLGRNQYRDIQANFAFNTVNGYRIKGHHFGLGLGLEKYSGNWYSPIYADYSFHFLKQKITPLIGVNGGFMVPLEGNDYYGYFGRYDYEKGAFVGGRVGFAAYTGEHFAFLLNITYRYVHLSGADFSLQDWSGVLIDYSGSADLHRIGFMIGFVFN